MLKACLPCPQTPSGAAEGREGSIYPAHSPCRRPIVWQICDGECVCKPDSVPCGAAIYLGRLLPGASSVLPGNSGEQPSRTHPGPSETGADVSGGAVGQCSVCRAVRDLPTSMVCGTLPYMDLLRAGFGKPPCHHDAGALLPHLFTLTGPRRREPVAFDLEPHAAKLHRQRRLPPSQDDAAGGLFSVPLSVGSPLLASRQRPALRSPDFPHPGSRGNPRELRTRPRDPLSTVQYNLWPPCREGP